MNFETAEARRETLEGWHLGFSSIFVALRLLSPR
jgi:hypothetical protein